MTVNEGQMAPLERPRHDGELNDTAARLMELVACRWRNEEWVSRARDCIDDGVWSDPIAEGLGSIS